MRTEPALNCDLILSLLAFVNAHFKNGNMKFVLAFIISLLILSCTYKQETVEVAIPQPETNIIDSTTIVDSTITYEEIDAEILELEGNEIEKQDLKDGWENPELYIIPEGGKLPIPNEPKHVANLKTEKMKFEGFEFGDYAHFMFTSEAGEFYDFAPGANTLGKLDYLQSEDSKSANAIGNWYVITWDNLWSTYVCCEGGQDIHYSFVPSIVEIKEVR